MPVLPSPTDLPKAVPRAAALHILLAFVFYFAAGRLGLMVPFTSGNVSPVWPAAGLALALMLRWGIGIWPGIALAAFLVNALTPLPAWAALGPATGNTLSAVVGALLLRRFPDFDVRLTKLRDVLLLIVIGAGLSTMLAATIGAGTFFAAGTRPWSDLPSAWLIWWLGDATGVLVAGPLLLNAGALTRAAMRSREMLILAAGTLGACLAIFDDHILGLVSHQPMAYMLFPFVVWAAIRFGVLGASAVNLVVAAAAVAATAMESGPFATNLPFYNALLLQLFIIVMAATGLILSAVVLERERAEAALKSERRLLQEREAAERGLREAEAGLRRNQERILLAQAAARLGYWEWNIASGEIAWSENIPALHGLPPDFRPDFERWWQLVHEEDRPLVRRALEDALAGTRSYAVEFRTPWPDGSLHWIGTQAHVVRDASGTPQRMVGTAMDITSRKEAELALKAEQDRLGGIIDSAMDAIITVDERQHIVLFNRAAENIFRCRAEAALGEPLDRFIPERFREAHRRHVEGFGHTGVTSRSMYRPGALVGLRADGEEFPLEATISQVVAGGQKLFTVILRDITERKQAEDAIIRSEKLASAGRLAATIAHEINNPLEAVMNLMYLVAHSESLSAEARTHLDMADLQLKRVAHITKQTLGFYRESSQPVPFRPAAVVEEVLELLGPRIMRKQVRLRREYADDELVGSPGEARQIFSNLLSNALDAVSSGGSISVRVTYGRDWGDHIRRGARIVIADDGEGIAPQHRQHIFEPFFTTKSQVGTGLGLWVAQQLTQRQGGWLRVRSCRQGVRRGSTFVCFLPDAADRRAAESVA
jgi:PAS domain S-box-containing protein